MLIISAVCGVREDGSVSDQADSFDFVQMFAALATQDDPGDAVREVFPDREITTERLLLRAYTEADIEDNAAMYDHDLACLWTNMPYPYTLEHSRIWCTRTANEIRTSGDGICWAVIDRVGGRLLGCTGLHRTNWRDRVADLSATGAPWAIGHGYAKEALRAISRWVLLDRRFNRLQITAAVGNPIPQRVAEACGFVREGVLRNAGITRFGQVDMVIYGLVPGDLKPTSEQGRARVPDNRK
jgi:RimJ/RimL family protein N-acetyltransferase